jgi:uroporphyrin-III C-methyltransferase
MSSDNDTSPDLNAPPVVASPRPAWRSPWFILALAALLLAGWQWLETRQQLSETRVEVARRLADAEAMSREDRGARGQLLAQIEGLQAKLGAVEGRLAEFENQGEALQSLYDEMARGREEATLLEVEQAITLAAQQLQLAGNVSVAALALQTADSRLARLDRPLYLPLRTALAKDMARLNSLPFVDVPGLSLRLEEVIIAVDKFPLGALGRPAEVAPVPAEPLVGGAWWQQAAREIWQEVKGLVRIQRFDQADQPLLAPGQSFFLRENLKLRLLNARLALLARDYGTFRNELKTAQDWLRRYFATDDKAVKAAQLSLQQLLAADLSIALPTLNDSHAALRELRNRKEKR